MAPEEQEEMWRLEAFLAIMTRIVHMKEAPMRDLSVIWTFDEETEGWLKALSGALTSPPVYPHITLGHYLWQEAPLIDYFAEMAPRFRPFWVQLGEIILLNPQVLACLPKAPELIRFHRLFHARHDEHADAFTSLSGGCYQPHITLASHEEGIDQALLQAAQARFSPRAGEVRGLKLSRQEADGSFTILKEHSLIQA